MRQRLTPAMMTFVVVDVILVVTFVALLVLLRPGLGSDGPPAADPGTVTDAPPETTPDTAAPSEPASPETFTAFVLPSGNIWCAMSATTATCTILSYTFTPPAPPEGCSGSVGHMLQVVAGDGSQLVCPDDPQPVPEDTPTLE
ncbi:MAG TPA: hypothetical protein PKB06_12085, partial [Actinotalea sp.]|nr:hypothetical protein [Actinotalea sp.]